jgi:hypothetical protein
MAIHNLGRVRHPVSPNALHHRFPGDWKSAYPEARLCAPPGLQRKRKDLAFDVEPGDAPEGIWRADIDQAVVPGSFMLTEIMFFHCGSQTALFADLIQNFRPDWFKGWHGLLARSGVVVTQNPGAPSDWRSTFINRRAARIALSRILAWPIEWVLIAHGDPAPVNGAAIVRRALAWLL